MTEKKQKKRRRLTVKERMIEVHAPTRRRLVAEVEEKLIERIDAWAAKAGYRTRWEALTYILTKALDAEEGGAA